jgi:hypothetical protein
MELLSQMLATILLDAWLSGDRYRLSGELDRMAALRRLPVDGAESDRMEILTSIAGEMQAYPDLFAPRTASARIGVWMDLLNHLSERRNALSN